MRNHGHLLQKTEWHGKHREECETNEVNLDAKRNANTAQVYSREQKQKFRNFDYL